MKVKETIEYVNAQLSDALESLKKAEKEAKDNHGRLKIAISDRIAALEKENADLLERVEEEKANAHLMQSKIDFLQKENADLLERAEAAEKAGEYVNAQLSDALESLKKAEKEAKDNHGRLKIAIAARLAALEKENADLRERVEEKIKIILDFPGDYDPEITRELEEKNADLRQKLAAARAILRGALSDLGEK